MDSLVSVIVPIYKISANLLERCIESLINQTEQKIEILLIDDGSPDRSGEICDEYAKRDSRIRVFHTENQGVSVARNIGIQNTSSPYLMFVDPDDYLMKDCIEKSLLATCEHDADILLFKHTSEQSVKKLNQKVKKIEKTPLELCVQTVIKDDTEYGIGLCWSKLFKTQFLRKNNLKYVPGVKKAQDRLFVYDCYTFEPKVYGFNYIGYYYTTDNETSICRRYNPEIVNTLENTAQKFEERLFKCNKEEFLLAAYKMRVLFLHEILILYLCHDDNRNASREIADEFKLMIRNSKYSDAIKKVKLEGLPKRIKLMVVLLRFHMYHICLKMYKL